MVTFLEVRINPSPLLVKVFNSMGRKYGVYNLSIHIDFNYGIDYFQVFKRFGCKKWHTALCNAYPINKSPMGV